MNRKSVLQIHNTTLTRILHFGACLTNLCRFVSTPAGSPSEHVERSVADLARLSELLLYHTNIWIITQTIFTQDWKIRCFPTLILIPTFDSVTGGHPLFSLLLKKNCFLVFFFSFCVDSRNSWQFRLDRSSDGKFWTVYDRRFESFSTFQHTTEQSCPRERQNQRMDRVNHTLWIIKRERSTNFDR